MHKTGSVFPVTVLLVFLVTALVSCAASASKNDGPKPLRPKILIGSSTKGDVEALFGSPTETLKREGEVWIYRGLKPEDINGLMPFYCGDKPLVFYFALDGTVSRISRRAPAL